jgi:hypothetical protein
MDPKDHWERIYRAKAPTELSWYQPEARLSLDLIRRVGPPITSTPVIDVGGGVPHAALAPARQRLGQRAPQVRWLLADVLDSLLPPANYGVWHDRAVFHFLTDPTDRVRYVAQTRYAVRRGGHVVVGVM